MKTFSNCKCTSTDEKIDRVRKIVTDLKQVNGALIPILHEVQHIYGYLPEEAIKLISAELKIPMVEIYGVATFYSIFSLQPKGRFVVKVCMGTACYVRGSQKILERLCKELDVEVNQTTKENQFTLEDTRCLGACGLAPVMVVNETVYGGLNLNNAMKILKKYKESEGAQ